MGDFYAACIRADGAVFHDPSNFHSTIATNFGLRDNTTLHDLRGKFPLHEFQCFLHHDTEVVDASLRNGQHATEAAWRAAEDLKSNLQKAIDDIGWGLFDDGVFADDNHADMRWFFLSHPRCPEHVRERLRQRTLDARGAGLFSHDEFPEGVDVLQGELHIKRPGSDVRLHNLQKVDHLVVWSGSVVAPALCELKKLTLRGDAKLVAPNLPNLEAHERIARSDGI